MKHWIKAARLRTLPLAASGILLGSAISYLNHSFQYDVLFLGISTALLLQILSNYGNDYGDFKKGTDQKAGRTDRMLAAGKITPGNMLKAIFLISAITMATGIFLLAESKLEMNAEMWLFLALGIIAMGAAIKYTIGKNAYAYYGLGDVFVFVFFGLVSVCGISYLHSGEFYLESLAAGIGCGALSAAVLNVNNIRDIESDKQSHKVTLPVRWGRSFAFVYHRILIWLGALFVFFSFILRIQKDTTQLSPMEYAMIAVVFSPVFILLAGHISVLSRIEKSDRMQFNSQLKKLSLTILLLVLIYWVISILYTA